MSFVTRVYLFFGYYVYVLCVYILHQYRPMSSTYESAISNEMNFGHLDDLPPVLGKIWSV